MLWTRKHLIVSLAGLATVSVLGSGEAWAQRDPAYAALRASGQVGEMPTGYLGFPVAPSVEAKRLAEDINIKRRANYAERASQQNATIESYAWGQGCVQIARSAPGEIYQAPDGSWRTRDASPPLRDARCP